MVSREIRSSFLLRRVQPSRKNTFTSKIYGYARPRKAGNHIVSGLRLGDRKERIRKTANTTLAYNMNFLRIFFKTARLVVVLLI
jgi:hypothetical protein